MKLKVPYIKQKHMTCGPTCIQMLLAYYGINVSLKDIMKQVPFYKDGTYLADLALFAAKKGFKAAIITYRLDFFDPTWFKLPKKKIIKKLRLVLKSRRVKAGIKRGCRAYAYYLEKGHGIIFDFPKKKTIIKYLKMGIPIIIRLDSTLLHKKKRYDLKLDKRNDITGEPTMHFVIISGYEKGRFIIADPSNTHGGIKRVPEEYFMMLCQVNYGDMLILERKK